MTKLAVIFASGVALALMILGGDQQMAYNTLLAAGLYAVILAFTKRDQEAAGQTAQAGIGAATGVGGARDNNGLANDQGSRLCTRRVPGY